MNYRRIEALTTENQRLRERVKRLEDGLRQEQIWYRRWAAWFHYGGACGEKTGLTEGAWAKRLDEVLAENPGITNPSRALLTKEDKS